MSESLLSNEKECYVCKTTFDIHKHHIYFGHGYRELSEKYGCWCYLCGRHHNLSNMGVHFNRPLDLKLKEECQRAFEAKCGTREDFMKIFGRNWIY